jgi:hypothetical protein
VTPKQFFTLLGRTTRELRSTKLSKPIFDQGEAEYDDAPIGFF